MAKAPAGKPAPDDKSKKQDPPADDKKKAAGEADDDADESTDDAGDKKPAPKPEKTYTKAELAAATAKAAADAIKKAEEEKDLSDLEKANNRIKELETQNRLRDAKDTVVEALKKAGARSSDLLWKTLQGDLEFDDSGKIKNLDTLVTSIKAEHPDQFGTEKPDETIDGGAGGGDKGRKALTKESLEKMTPEAINELDWADVSKVLAAP